MKTILITGGIGSGKSLARKYLEKKGFPVYDCDSRCKALYEEVPGLRERIEERLGIRFSEIGRIFDDASLRTRLEKTVFPVLKKDIVEWKKSNRTCSVAFIESATALEHNEFDDCYDEVWMIDASLEKRQERNPDTAKRAKLQHFDLSRVDRIITNEGSKDELYDKIDKLTAQLI